VADVFVFLHGESFALRPIPTENIADDAVESLPKRPLSLSHPDKSP